MTQVIHQKQRRNFSPDRLAFERDVLRGLSRRPRRLPCKYLYDERGSRLFDDICELPEYYPTRTEVSILEANIDAIARAIGTRVMLIEYGSGSGTKTRLLLDHLRDPAAYVPIDISGEQLLQATVRLGRSYPSLEILPVCADYTKPFQLPEPSETVARRVVFFPGSTIGNFHPRAAQRFLEYIAHVVGPGGGLLIGFDQRKSPDVLNAAYNDAAGVTAAFNLNLLARINRQLAADFDLSAWQHHALYEPVRGRIEMHLLSQCPQTVRMSNRRFRFEAWESIRTECSYKYTPAQFAAMMPGWDRQDTWSDDENRFCVMWLTRREC